MGSSSDSLVGVKRSYGAQAACLLNAIFQGFSLIYVIR